MLDKLQAFEAKTEFEKSEKAQLLIILRAIEDIKNDMGEEITGILAANEIKRLQGRIDALVNIIL